MFCTKAGPIATPTRHNVLSTNQVEESGKRVTPELIADGGHDIRSASDAIAGT
jgi:hypothetical protein